MGLRKRRVGRMSIKWEIIYEKPARKYLATLEAKDQERIKSEVDKLSDGPFNRKDLDIKKLKGRDGWRLRIGKYRVIFMVYRFEVRINVLDVGSRGDVYKN